MKWVFPEFLFALAVILIPLIIHLFHFKRYKTVFFSSLTFLKSIEQNQKSTRKLKYWLIFTTRALAFVFLVFAFAQPYLPLSDSSQKSGADVVGVYIDNSFSMTRIGQTGELISQARELAESISKDVPRNAKFILITNELSGEEKQTLTKAQFLDKIETISPSPLVRSANDVVRWWQQWETDYERNNATIANSQLIYLSDFQKSTFGKIRKVENWNTLVYPIVLEPVNEGNIYIDTIWFASPIQKLGSKQTLYVRIKNESEQSNKTLDVSIRIGAIKRDVFADLPAFGSDTVELSYFNNQLGKIQGSAIVNDKQMTQDDAFYFSYDVNQKSNVLILDGEDAVSNIATVFGLDDFYAVRSIPQSQLSERELKDVELVVVNGFNQFGSTTESILSEFALDGGSVVLFPGANASFSGWNVALKKLSLPSLGAIQQNGLLVKKIAINDPFFDGVFDGKPKEVSLPAVNQSYRLSEASNSQFIDLLSYQNGGSFFVRGTGKLRVYLSATSLDNRFSSFTSNQLFSTLLLRIAELSQRQAPPFLIVGENNSYPIAQATSTEKAVHLVNNMVDYIPTLFRKNEQSFVSIQGSEAVRRLIAGNYLIQSGDEKLGALSVNYNRKESSIGKTDAEEIKTNFAEVGIEIQSINNATGWSGASFLQLEQPVSYWKWCLILVILFVLLEMVIVLLFKK